MGSIFRTWELIKESFRVLVGDSKLIVFPIKENPAHSECAALPLSYAGPRDTTPICPSLPPRLPSVDPGHSTMKRPRLTAEVPTVTALWEGKWRELHGQLGDSGNLRWVLPGLLGLRFRRRVQRSDLRRAGRRELRIIERPLDRERHPRIEVADGFRHLPPKGVP